MEKDNIDFVSLLNAHGVVGREFTIDAPFLTDPLSLMPINYLKVPIEIVNFKSFDTISDKAKDIIHEQVSSLFMLSHDSYVDYQNSFFYPNILNAENCNNPILQGQYGLFTKARIKQYQVLGFYSGLYISSSLELEHLMTQFDYLTIGRYGNACFKEGIPVICGHYNGNYMTIINDWRPFKWYEYDEDALQTLKNQSYSTNSIVARAGDYYFIVYVATCDVDANTELLTDYGHDYWEREKSILLQ